METEIIPYSRLRIMLGKREARLEAMCRGLHVLVLASLNRPPGTRRPTGAACERLLRLITNVGTDPSLEPTLADLLISPCMPFIHASTSSPLHVHPPSLQSYYHGPSLVCELEPTRDGATFIAIPRPVIPPWTQHFVPRIAASDPCVLSALQQGLPCLDASSLAVVREKDVSDWEVDDLPRVVEECEGVGRTGGKRRLCFKPVGSTAEAFRRELGALLRIREVEAAEGRRLGTSRLAGLVRWEREEDGVGGLVVEYIAGGRGLDRAVGDAGSEERRRWGREVRETVGRLHEHGIVWGNVKRANVVVDAEGRAWVVDFGGGFSPEWVDEGLEGTKEGDLQGVARIEEWLESYDVVDMVGLQG